MTVYGCLLLDIKTVASMKSLVAISAVGVISEYCIEQNPDNFEHSKFTVSTNL
jgi:hypothetical protein